MTIGQSVLVCLLLSLATYFGGCDANKKVNWENIPKIRSSDFRGADLAWLITERDGALLSTSDGGKTWNQVPGNAVGAKFDVVAFNDRKRGWAVNNKGWVWKSDDGGESWLEISRLTPTGSDDWQFNSAGQIKFIDDRNGWIIETLSIWRTVDGGVNWRKVFPIGSGQSNVKGQPTSGYFDDPTNVWVTGTSGEIYRTKDGGESWQAQTLLPNGDFNEVYFVDGNTGWLLGYLGGETGTQLYRTDDGGQSWLNYPIARVQIQWICFINGDEGWAVGSEGSSAGAKESIRGVVLRTGNGGRSWNRIDIATEDRSFDRIHFVDRQNGWLIGRNGLYRTEDGGKAWRPVLPFESIGRGQN